MSAQADREKVAQTLNLAAHLVDGAKIYIPALGESAPVSGGSSGTETGLGSQTLNLNTASEKDLDSLPGVGAVTAQKIINGRPYAQVQELLDKKIVSSKVFEEIKEKVSVY